MWCPTSLRPGISPGKRRTSFPKYSWQPPLCFLCGDLRVHKVSNSYSNQSISLLEEQDCAFPGKKITARIKKDPRNPGSLVGKIQAILVSLLESRGDARTWRDGMNFLEFHRTQEWVPRKTGQDYLPVHLSLQRGDEAHYRSAWGFVYSSLP